MKRPTIVCHMMTSADGRIDCAMTAKLRGVDDYYATLAALEAPSRARMDREMRLRSSSTSMILASTTSPSFRQSAGLSMRRSAI